MAVASSNIFPKVIFAEGSAPTTPSSGQQVIYWDSADHVFKSRNASGTVTPIGGGAMAQLGDLTISGSTTTNFTFSSIPGSYLHLLMVGDVRADESTTDDYALMRYNSDTGSNYFAQVASFASTTVSGAAFTGKTYVQALDVPCATAGANIAGSVQIWIPCYTDTTFYKQVLTQCSYGDAGYTTPGYVAGAGFWKNTAAITQIDIIAPASGHWIAGSHLRLYGVN